MRWRAFGRWVWVLEFGYRDVWALILLIFFRTSMEVEEQGRFEEDNLQGALPGCVF